jgi:hypothetical protein
LNVASASVVRTSPQEHQPHVDPSPSSQVISSSPYSLAIYSSISYSSLSEISEESNSVDNKKKKRKIKKKKNKQGSKLPNTTRHFGQKPVTIIIPGVLMMPRSPKKPISPSTLAGFVRVSILLRIYLVYPRL